MKIDKEKLIGLLIEKTGMEKAEVEEQLQQLIKRIVDAAERGKALEIKEFGMFYFDEGGELRFDAAKELSTEVNFKYAGMEPVELKPARESANQQEDEEEDTEAASAKKEETAAEEEKAKDQADDDADDVFGIGAAGTQKKSDKVDEDKEEKKDTERPELADDEYDFEYEEGEPKEREEDPFAGLLGDASSKMQKGEPSGFEVNLLSEEAKRKLAEEEESKEEEPVEHEEEPVESDQVATSSDDKDEIDEDIFAGLDDLDDLDDEPAELPEEPAEKKTPEPEPVAVSARRPAPKPKKKERDPIMMVLGVILALVLIGSAFVIIPSLMDGPDPDPNQVPATAPQQPAVDEDIADAQDVLVPLEPEADAEVTEEMADETEAAEDSDQPIYGLTGEIVDQANDGFSIVLFSLRQEERARDQAANLSEDGYRVIVNSRTVDGETVWRVSVGQFESIADAQAGATDLPSPYNTNNFIQRIQTN